MRKDLKVALIGNMNNNFFSLSRYLRDEGIDSHLFTLADEPSHFDPSADSNSIEDLASVTRLPWGYQHKFSKVSVEEIKKHFTGFTHFIGSGTAPAFLNKAGIKLDVFIPYGGDLYQLPFRKARNPLNWYNNYSFRKHQCEGIRKSSFCSIADHGEIFDRMLAKIRFGGKRLFSGVPMVYFRSDKEKSSPWLPQFRKIRKENELVIFHHSRHCWLDETDPVSLKDNDKLFKGLSLFLQKNPTRKVAIVTLEYGTDVENSKALVKSLGLCKRVHWFPLMDRKDLMDGLEGADIVAGEFRNSWLTYGVVLEAMAVAKPVMHFRDDKLYPESSLYPMLHASNENDIASLLHKYIDNKSELKQVGMKAREWYFKHSVNASLKDIKAVLYSKLALFNSLVSVPDWQELLSVI